MSEGARALRLGPDGRLGECAFLDDLALRQLLDLLGRDGGEARVVGGAVRNALLGLPVNDVDIATTLLPDEVVARTRAARLRSIPTGIAHGTVTVRIGRTPFEVTTLREDVETDGRHAVVRFGRDFRTDAARRDFTINALSVGADRTIHDTTGGVADLAAGRVRFIGDADRRIREDHLRILRLFRFHASYGVGPLDGDGLAASTRHRDALTHLSRERIRAELLKLMAAPGVVPVLRAMEEAGVAAVVLNGPCRPGRLARLVAEDRPGGASDPLLRLAALALDAPAEARRLREALRLSNGETDRLTAAAAARQRLDPAVVPAPDRLRALLFDAGRRTALDGARLAAADAPDASAWREAIRFLRQEAEPRLGLSGTDVMARGVASGRRIGMVLKRLQADWIRAGFPADPVSLEHLLDAAVAAEAAGPEPVRPIDST